MSGRRMLPFILLNIVVSSVVILGWLYWWDTRQPETAVSPAVDLIATLEPTPIVPETAGEGAPSLITPEAAPAVDGQIRYVVQAGDTLGSISARFDIPIEAIMAANGLDNPNLISVGQSLIMPTGDVLPPTAVPTLTPTTSAPPTPIEAVATAPPAEAELRLTISNVIGPGVLVDEAVTIANLGSRPVGLQGWTLENESGRTYTFGQVTIFGDGAAILVHTESGVNGPTNLYWGLDQPVWRSGGTVTLRDAGGVVRATFNIP